MAFQSLVSASRQFFPKLQIKYKDQSLLMKIMSIFLFFNPNFMTKDTTTVGYTIYFPSEKFVKCHPASCEVILLHELVHLYDQKRVGTLTFIISYLFPQIMVPICLLLFWLVSWKIMLPLTILFLAPMPAVFRTYWEKRAYLSSIYILKLMGDKLHFNPHLKEQENVFLEHFHGSSYYFMWPFHDINKRFDEAIEMAKLGKRPFEDPVFNILEHLAAKV
jgi:hypothetical protein